MAELLFKTREDFRAWLLENAGDSGGVWLVFGKNQSVKTLKASEALEEALCFGWIDGQMRKVDDSQYLKYFAPRRKDSPWSEKNRGLAETLITQGKMTPQGLKRIEEAKADGRWNAPGRMPISEEQVTTLAELLTGHEPAFGNFQSMSPSVRRQYAGLYFDAKSDEARTRRLEKIIGRLNQNLKPM